MAEQPTLIERLNVAHEGLEKDVCLWLKEFWTCEEIAEELLKKYAEEVSPKTVDNYRQRRFKRSIERIRLQRESYTALIEASGEKGLTAKVEVDAERVENEKQELTLKLKNAEGQIAKVKQAVTDGAESNEQADPKRIRRDIQEILGISDDGAEKDGHPAALPGCVDQG
jgi:hypothetical protein